MTDEELTPEQSRAAATILFGAAQGIDNSVAGGAFDNLNKDESIRAIVGGLRVAATKYARSVNDSSG